MSAIEIHQVDVFADRPFRGNPAAVVPDATGLSESRMQAIARELNLSETAFVLPRSDARDATLRVRFFTPLREVPACGHATLAVHAVRALRSGTGEGSIVQESAGGRWLVEWRLEGARRAHVTMVQGPLRVSPAIERTTCEALWSALGIPRHARPGRLPVRILSTGHPKVVVPVAEVQVLRELRPDFAALCEIGERLGVPGFFVFATIRGRPWNVEARMFAPGLGILEDPVNGSGHGTLGAYGVLHRVEGLEEGRFRSRMGDAVGRPGMVDVRVEMEGGSPRRVRVGGSVVPVWRGVAGI